MESLNETNTNNFSNPFLNWTDLFGGFDGFMDYTEYIYPGYSFERPVYLYIWEILVIVTTIFNILLIVVLLGKGMINSTNMILVAIAASDSMTGITTLPTYIHVYQQFLPGGEFGQDSYILTKEWCKAFMISKFFVSRSFHTISIWLTVFLGFQRFVSVWFPFKAQSIFTKKKTVVFILIIAILCPLLHVYHLVDEKTEYGLCSWILEKGCGEGCAYLWLSFLLMHVAPCSLLIIFTALMLKRLLGSAAKMREMAMVSNTETNKRRADENRRISFVVISVVIVFLIPEVPYGIYIFITVIRRHAGLKTFPLKNNRIIECAYEIMLVLSFHANFWVYTMMNRKFRDGLRRKFSPVIKCINTLRKKEYGVHQGSESKAKTTMTDQSSKSDMELKHVQANSSTDDLK